MNLWTNMFSSVMLYIVFRKEALRIWSRYWILQTLVLTPAIILATISAVYADINIYGNTRNIILLISVVYNLSAYMIVKIHMTYVMDTSDHHWGALRMLASRIKYYPLVQIVSRIPAIAYHLLYGFDSITYEHQTDPSRFVSLVFYALFVPGAGIGYFFVFLTMKPVAYRKLLSLFGCSQNGIFSSSTASSAVLSSHLESNAPSNPMQQTTTEMPRRSDVSAISEDSTGGKAVRHSDISNDSGWNCLEEMDELELEKFAGLD